MSRPQIGFGRAHDHRHDDGSRSFSFFGIVLILSRNALVVWHLLVLGVLVWLLVRDSELVKEVESLRRICAQFPPPGAVVEGEPKTK